MFGRRRGRRKSQQRTVSADELGPIVSATVLPTETAARQAAASGSPEEMNRLGVMLKMNDKEGEAATWFAKAADAGSQDAMANMALLLLAQGRKEEAAQWFRRAGGPLGEALAQDLNRADGDEPGPDARGAR